MAWRAIRPKIALHCTDIEFALECGAHAFGCGGKLVTKLAADRVGEKLWQRLLHSAALERIAESRKSRAKRLAGDQRGGQFEAIGRCASIGPVVERVELAVAMLDRRAPLAKVAERRVAVASQQVRAILAYECGGH